MNTFGIVMISLSIVFCVVIAVLGTYYSNKRSTGHESFFTAGRNVSVAFMTATFIAYAVGTGLVFAPGEAAFTMGFTAVLGYAVAISIAYIVFVPLSRKIRTRIPEGHTIGEYTKTRYGTFMYLVSLVVTIIYMFILLVSNLIGAAITFKYLGGVPMWLSVLAIGLPIIYFAAFGGVGAAILTNGMQSLLITPLLIIPAVFVLVNEGGPGAVYDKVAAIEPEFLEIGGLSSPGTQFAIMIVIALVAAECLNQTLWQRIYTARSERVLRKSLISSAVMVFPMTIVAAFFGLAALAMGLDVPHTSVVSALAIHHGTPNWVSAAFILVVVLAASSTGGDALSGFSSIFSIDIVKRIRPDLKPAEAVTWGRIGVVIFGIAGMVVAFFAPSILFLLLLADLLASATVVPIIAGLYTSRVTGTMAALSTIVGILASLPMFIQGQSLPSFATALVVSSLGVAASHLFSKKRFDHDRLRTEIKSLA